MAQIRIITCVTLLALTIREDLPGLIDLPQGMRRETGLLMRTLYALPIGLDRLTSSRVGLGTLQVATIGLLTLGALGWRSRITLPLALIAAVLVGGIWREYSHFYHTGLLPLYVLGVLAVVPCAETLSLDALVRRRREEKHGSSLHRASDATISASILLCWLAMSLPYVMAGIAKLSDGGMYWFHADTMRQILHADNLNPMSFHLGLGECLARAPDWLLSGLALGTIAIEIGFIAVPFHRLTRAVIPLLAAGMHLGILLFQNVPFPDLIVMQLIFYNLSRRKGENVELSPLRMPVFHKLAALAMVTIAAYCVWRRLESYPLTSMAMYSDARPVGVVRYWRVTAHFSDGREGDFPFDEAVPAMGKGEGRYRDILYAAFADEYPVRQRACYEFVQYAADQYNRLAPAQPRITEVKIQLRSWDFRSQPNDPDRGEPIASQSIPIEP